MTDSGQVLKCTIDSLGYQGEGICRLDGQVVFVPRALPGEQAAIKIHKRRKHLAFAQLLQILSPSDHRVQPLCPHFSSCGGCAVQHMSQRMQHDFKRRAVADNLWRIAGQAVEVQPVIGQDNPWSYRNKTTWQLRFDQGVVSAGFFAAGSHDVVPVQRCWIASAQSNVAKDVVASWLNGCLEDGLLENTLPVRHLVTRSNQAGETLLILTGSALPLPRVDQLVESLHAALPGFIGICASRDLDSEEVAMNTPVELLDGSPSFKESLLGLNFTISPLSFFQVNHKICEAVYSFALEQAILKPEGTLLDLYSGAGTISLLAAQHCREVVGIEYAQEAVEDARHNAALNKIKRARFYSGKAEDVLPQLMKKGFQPDAVILDPPRKGAHPLVLDAIIKAQPKRIVYISCHPASQARDAASLAKAGYQVVLAQPFDMFPQTSEIENVITFVRSAG